MPDHDILIAGAGIGGLATALALERFGFTATIWEKAPELREVGAGLLLTSNAVAVLDHLGLREAVTNAGRAVCEWRILDQRGRVLQVFAAGERRPSISITRSAFRGLLARRLQRTAIVLDREIVSVATIPSSKKIAVASKVEEHEPDILISADGTHSAVRGACFSAEPPRFAGYVGWRALVDHMPQGWTEGLITESWADGCRFGIAPVDAGRCYWYATENAARGLTVPPDRRKQHLLEKFARWHAPIAEMIDATPPGAILLNDITELHPLRSWVNGPIALLGDAAHSMTPNLGQGAAMALEDAWTLAECFAESGNAARALSNYQQKRAARVRAIVVLSRQVGRLIQLQHPLLTAVRDAGLRLTPDWLGALGLSPVFNFRA